MKQVARSRFYVTCWFLVLAAAAQAAEDGQVRRAWLGVTTADMSASMRTLIGRDYRLGGDAGVVVTEAAANSPAARAGIRKNDVIVRVGATLITSGRQLGMTVGRLRPGQTVEVAVLRDVTVLTRRVTLGAIDSAGRTLLVEPRDEGPADPVATLFEAAAQGDAARVAELIAGGADVRAKNAQGQVPLHVACAGGHTQAAKLLIDADQARGRAELSGTLITNFDEYMTRTSPTLGVRDGRGDTPLHAAARSGRAAAAKLVLDSGADKNATNRDGQTAGQIAAQQGFAEVAEALGDEFYRYDPPSDGPPTSVTRYAPKLRELLARVRDIEQRFGRSSANPESQEKVAALGEELQKAGAELEAMLAGSGSKMTRFGTVEEADLLEAIKGAYQQAGTALRAQALAELESEKTNRATRNQMQQALRMVGRTLIEQEAVRWMRRHGLEDLLVENGRSVMGRELGQGIELNLRTFLDKKSMELVGMPLGGFRSIQAAFRLQARRAVREVVANLVLNFTGNQLVVQLLQRHIVRWIETDLWPQLREAFRPKTHLARRVRISSETMAQASEALNRLAGGQRPADIPLKQVVEAVDRAEGKIYAARYLKRDLERAQNQELIDELQAAENLLARDIRRVRHQFLIADLVRWEEMEDNLEITLGVYEDVGKILAAMPEEQQRVRAGLEAMVRAGVAENVAGTMALIHEESPYHTPEVAGRIRQYFATHITVSQGLHIAEIIKRSDRDVEVAFSEMVGSTRESMRLIFRRSDQAWKLYGLPGES